MHLGLSFSSMCAACLLCPLRIFLLCTDLPYYVYCVFFFFLCFGLCVALQSVKRSAAGVVKSSMFSAPAELTGKVGVTNSGRGMTAFAERKKHKFEL
jgi:hypothetical protein